MLHSYVFQSYMFYQLTSQIAIFILTLTASLHLTSGSKLPPYEQTMLDKLHKPWFVPDKYEQEYPRKGETKCKGGPCRVKEQICDDCQYNVPIFDEEFIEKIKGKRKSYLLFQFVRII